MALKLTVLSDQRGALGRDASIVLGVGGGTIGRAHDNDWVLPDPQCYLSAHHARVQFRNGSYYLLDTSTNGTYVNGGTVPIGRRNIYPLRDGDSLRLGQYQIAVDIEAESAESPEAPEASSIFPVNAAPQAAGNGIYPADIGVSLDLRALLRAAADSQGTSSRIGPVDAFGQSVSIRSVPIEDTGLLVFDRSGQRPALSGVPATPRARRERAAADQTRDPRATRPPGAPPAGAELAAMDAFCRGAGLDSRRLPPDAQSGLLHLAGLLLREALVGLKGLALAQRELRDQTRIEVGREDPQHIGLTGLSVEDLLLRLLLGHSRHELDAVQWLRDTAASSRSHDLAMMRALPAALAEFVARLDPAALSHHNAAPGASGGTASTGVTARFRSITEMPTGGLPHLFAEAFARAFTAEFRHNARDQSES